MNHIYRVIFNKATGTFTAVAEYAKSHTKTGGSDVVGATKFSTKKTFGLSAIALAVISISGQAWALADGEKNKLASWAGTTITGGNYANLNNGGDVIAAEGGLELSGPERTNVTLGKSAGVESRRAESVAVGFQAQSRDNWSIAMGARALALKEGLLR